MALLRDGASIEEKITGTVSLFVDIALGVQTIIGEIEHNTREIFWWTSWGITIVLGLFVLHLLVRVRAQLIKLNAYQDVFQRMWREDRINDERVRREERRERQVLGMRRAGTARARQRPDRDQNTMQEVLGAIEDIPPEGTAEYDQFLADMRREMNARRN